MKQIDLGVLLKAISYLGTMTERIVRPYDVLGDRDPVWINFTASNSSIGVQLHIIKDVAMVLDLPATGDAARSYQSTFGRLTATKRADNSYKLTRELVADLRRDWDHISTSMRRELVQFRTFVISPGDASLVDDALIQFGEEAIAAFPGICEDVISATKCHVFELWTASLMHTMRVAEVGVGAFADYLTVPRGKTWGGTIQEVLKALDDAKGNKGDRSLQARLSDDAGLKQWASEVASYLNFVKDAFRNPAMHPELTFSREQAIAIRENTRMFMRTLAKRLHVE